MTQTTICFIGAGNMASSLIGGLISNQFPADHIIACDVDEHKLEQLRDERGIQISTDNNEAIQRADVVVLAVKPQVLQPVCRALTSTHHHPLFLSIAAGIHAQDIDRWLGGNQALVRCMPNTPALVGLGASALFANRAVNSEQRSQAEKIMSGTGITTWVDEETELDAVTAISGSGPAYFFLFIEALQKSAMALGLSEENAARLARQTALGAATMAIDKDVVTLRQQVTSPGGTTEQAIQSFQQNRLDRLVDEATEAARQRALELGQELTDS